MHSLLNLFNILLGQLYVAGILLFDREDALAPPIRRTKNYVEELQGQPEACFLLETLPQYRQALLAEMDAAMPAGGDDVPTESQGELASCFEAIEDCLGLLSVRCCEVVHLTQPNRRALPHEWFRGETRPPGAGSMRGVYFTGLGRWRELEIDGGGEVLPEPQLGPGQVFARRIMPFLAEHARPGCRLTIRPAGIPESGKVELTATQCRFPYPWWLRTRSNNRVEPCGFIAYLVWALQGAFQDESARVDVSVEGESLRFTIRGRARERGEALV